MSFKFVAALLLSAAAFTAQAEVLPPKIDVEALKAMTKTLSSDEFEGRAPMTAGEVRTIAYISEAFKAAGLQPGHNGTWFQEVPLVEMTVEAGTGDLSFAKGGNPVMTAAYGKDAVAWTKRVEPGVKVTGSELVFVGYGINAPEKGWNDYDGIDMRGKTAVILVNDPDWEMRSLDGPFGGRAMTYYGRWTYKFEEAARQGAAAAIIVHSTEPASYGWATVQSSWTGPQLDLDGAGDAPRVAIEGWIQEAVAARLMGAAGQDLKALSGAAKVKGFKAVPLGVTMSSELKNIIRKAKSNNVVGILPGTGAADEYVLYSAHWDHLGRCGADASGDDICNGALDNATGTAGLMTLAKTFADAGPARRSVVFVAVTGEESGLLGSEYYAVNPSFPLSRTVAGINMDGLNIDGPTHDVVVVGFGKSELEQYLEAEVAGQGRRIEREPTPESGSFYRSDHFSLAKRGVPTLYAGSGIDIVGRGKESGQAAADDYSAKRYHQPNDEYDPNWNWDGAVDDLTINYMIGRRIAESDAWPNWNAGDEFRATRDASLAAGK